MDKYNKFLAENVLTEDKVVTYRLLSRALQVHVNTAKQMLYDFHRSQNAKRPGAVHATYLVFGTKKDDDGPPAARNGGDVDVEMTSSAPEAEQPTTVVPTSTLSLVPEEQLEETLANYEEVTSIHVYSIGPHPTKDLALLVDAANEALSLDSSDYQKSLGPINNPRVRRRERQGPGLKAAAAATTAVNAPAKSAFPKTALAPASGKVKEEPKPAQSVQETAEKASSGPTRKAAPPSKRGAGSGIMQAFSKAATKQGQVKKAAESSQPAAPSGEESMQPLSDDGEDDEELPQPKPRSISGTKSKKQREEELRRMMEEEDEEDQASEEAETPLEEEPMEEDLPAPEPAKEQETEVVTSSSNGRRRGKRRVVRKKQIMDEQGYLVTIQEPGWESFSEDEPPPTTKPKTTSSAPAAQAGKPKKGGQKGGQGSIMSFFSKK